MKTGVIMTELCSGLFGNLKVRLNLQGLAIKLVIFNESVEIVNATYSESKENRGWKAVREL